MFLDILGFSSIVSRMAKDETQHAHVHTRGLETAKTCIKEKSESFVLKENALESVEIEECLLGMLKLQNEANDLVDTMSLRGDIPEDAITQIGDVIQRWAAAHNKILRKLGESSFSCPPVRVRVAAAIDDIEGPFTTKDVTERLLSAGLMAPAKGLAGRVNNHILGFVAKGELEMIEAPRRGHAGEYQHTKTLTAPHTTLCNSKSIA